MDRLEQGPRPAGKLVKALQGPRDQFLRLRVGDYRVIYEVIDPTHVVLVHGIVQRKDLEEWLRQQK